MDGGKDKLVGLNVKLLKDGAPLLSQGGVIDAVVVHHVTAVAYEAVAIVGKCGGTFEKAFTTKVVDSGFGRGEADARKLVADNTVEFLRHSHIEGTETCFDMEHRDVQFGCSDGTRKSGIGVAVEYDAVERIGEKDLFDTRNHLGRLNAMGTRTYAEIVVGLGDAEFVEEDLRHVGIVVLTGVEYFLFDGAGEMVADRRYID